MSTNLNVIEYAKYKLAQDVTNGNIDLIQDKFYQLSLEIDAAKEEVPALERRIEMLEEQVYFRDEFIQEIVDDCNCPGMNKKQLVKAILARLADSYIELS